jgi:hypothetical protein
MPLDVMLIPPTNLRGTSQEYMEQMIKDQQLIRELAGENIKNKIIYDKHAREPNYNEFGCIVPELSQA